jgi:hypothetical protein
MAWRAAYVRKSITVVYDCGIYSNVYMNMIQILLRTLLMRASRLYDSTAHAVIKERRQLREISEEIGMVSTVTYVGEPVSEQKTGSSTATGMHAAYVTLT